MAWTDVVTQGFNPPTEYGTDFGVPFHTPIPDVLAGVVQRIICAATLGYRCEVDIASSLGGQPVTETYLHIDRPAVTVGQSLAPGDLVGLSGGQLSGGDNPDQYPYSTGPHVEFDIFRGGPFQNPIDPLAIARGGPSAVTGTAAAGGPQDVIAAIISALSGGTNFGQIAAGAQQAGGSVAQGLGLAAIGQGVQDLGQSVEKLPADVGHGLANALGAGIHNVGTWAHNQIVPLLVALVVALVLFGGAL